MNKTLTTLVQDQLALDDLMIATAGELSSDEVENIITSWMDEVKSGIAEKVDSYEFKQQAIEAQASKFKARADLLYNAAKQLNNLSDNLKNRMKFAMLEMNVNTLSGHLFKYNLYKGKKALVILDQKQIPDRYIKELITYSVDKDAIRIALDAGYEVPGVTTETALSLRTFVNKG